MVDFDLRRHTSGLLLSISRRFLVGRSELATRMSIEEHNSLWIRSAIEFERCLAYETNARNLSDLRK